MPDRNPYGGRGCVIATKSRIPATSRDLAEEQRAKASPEHCSAAPKGQG